MNSNEHKQLDQLLKDQLSEGSVPVPDFVWDRIEEELFPKKKRRGFFWWFFGAFCFLSMAVLLGISFSGEKAHSQNISLSHTTVSKTATTSISEDKKPIRNKQPETDPNFHKTKSVSSIKVDKHITKRTKSSDSNSRPDSYRDAHFNQKTSKSILKKHSKSQTSISISPGELLSEKTKTDSFPASIKQQQNHLNKLNVPITDSNPITQSTPEEQVDEAISEVETKTDSSTRTDLSYEDILALVKRDFSKSPNEWKEPKSNSIFSLGIYGGPSMYNSAVFKDYFTSGQLSNRTFASSGFELGLQARFKIGNRFQVYAGFAFNQKQTQFNYNLAITEADYFTYVANEEKVPFENIQDDGANNCFLAKDVHVRYQTQSLLLSLGTSFEFLKIRKFSAAVDLRLSCNVYSSLQLKEIRVLDIQEPNSEKFSYFQPGAGLSLNYQLNRRISLGLSPFFSKQFYLKESYSRKLSELVIPVTVSFQF